MTREEAEDLVSRLRNENYAKSQTLAASYMQEAAAEIVRMRSTLEDIETFSTDPVAASAAREAITQTQQQRQETGK